MAVVTSMDPSSNAPSSLQQLSILLNSYQSDLRLGGYLDGSIGSDLFFHKTRTSYKLPEDRNEFVILTIVFRGQPRGLEHMNQLLCLSITFVKPLQNVVA